MFRAKSSLLTATLVIFLILGAGIAEACPTCKDGVSENSANLVRGFGWSIIFMMSMPFLILGGLGGYFYLEVRRAQRQLEQRNDQGELDVRVPTAG